MIEPFIRVLWKPESRIEDLPLPGAELFIDDHFRRGCIRINGVGLSFQISVLMAWGQGNRLIQTPGGPLFEISRLALCKVDKQDMEDEKHCEGSHARGRSAVR